MDAVKPRLYARHAGPEAMAAAAAEVDRLAGFTLDATHSVPDMMMQPVAMGRVATPEEVRKWAAQARKG